MSTVYAISLSLPRKSRRTVVLLAIKFEILKCYRGSVSELNIICIINIFFSLSFLSSCPNTNFIHEMF